jgi:hypothetical protein
MENNIIRNHTVSEIIVLNYFIETSMVMRSNIVEDHPSSTAITFTKVNFNISSLTLRNCGTFFCAS